MFPSRTGVAGFEPTHEGVKVPCLTAWLYPNIYTHFPLILSKILYQRHSLYRDKAIEETTSDN